MKGIFSGCLTVALLVGTILPSRANRLQIEEQYLTEKPGFVEDPGLSQGDVKAIYMDGPLYKGQPSRVFAFYGIPKSASGKKVPAIVLVHGGGGTAFPEWVKLWMDRGYAAIALDLFGNVPLADGTRIPLEGGGPVCGPDFVHLDDPFPDQWPYYAENAIARARTLLGTLPEVDDARVGITGISWGGFLSSMASALDKRYAFAIHVYGCGFLKLGSAWAEELNEPGKERWTEWFDPSHYLPDTSTPTLWLTGTNDGAFSIESFVKSYQLVETAPLFLCIRVNMPHGNVEGWSPPEIQAFADSVCFGTPPLPAIKQQGQKAGNTAWIQFDSKIPIDRAELIVGQKGADNWKERSWTTLPATIRGTQASAKIPQDAALYFFNIYDRDGLMVSSPIFEATAR